MQQQQQNLEPTVEEQEAGINEIRGVYEDGFADINGRRYTFHKMRHLDRREVFAYFTTIKEQLFHENFGFMLKPDFSRIEQLVLRSVSCDGMIMAKAPEDWWDGREQEYTMLVSMALTVISVPFFPGVHTASTSGTPSPTGEARSRKPMLG